MKITGNEIHNIYGKNYCVWQARLKDEMYVDEDLGNPLLWFAMRLSDRDAIVCGVKTKREALVTIREDSLT